METIKQALDLLNKHLTGFGNFSIVNEPELCDYYHIILEIYHPTKNCSSYASWRSFNEFINGSQQFLSFFEFAKKRVEIQQKLNINVTDNLINDIKNVKSQEEFYIKLNLLGIV